MSRRAKLNLSPDGARARKQPPTLDPEPSEEPAFLSGSPKPAPPFDGRRLARILMVVAVGALAVYALKRRLS